MVTFMLFLILNLSLNDSKFIKKNEKKFSSIQKVCNGSKYLISLNLN